MRPLRLWMKSFTSSCLGQYINISLSLRHGWQFPSLQSFKSPFPPAHPMARKKGTYFEMEIPEDREIVETDSLAFPWREDKKGYFLVKIEEGKICCGYLVNHKMTVEFRGRDPYNIIKEIAKRGLANLEHMGYIAAELMRAKDCLS